MLQAREDLIADIVGKMPVEHRRFLASFKKGDPQLELLNLQGVEELPAVLWRLQNLVKLDEGKRATLLRRLCDVLDIDE